MHMRIKTFLKFACKLVCLTLVLCIAFSALPLFAEDEATGEEKPATIDIVVAIKDIPQGTRINDSHVKLVTFPNENIPANAITDTSLVYDKYAATDLHEGEYIYSGLLSSKKTSKTNNDLLNQPIVESEDAYVVVTDYIKADTGEDVAALLQELIDKNPKRTLYFPDGEYIIGSPLLTSDVPSKSTTFHLSDGAVIKASDRWVPKNGVNYLISIGGNNMGANDVISPGSYYSFIGGTLDGNGYADGLSYTAGRETLIRNVCIKNVDVGIFVETGSNSGSSDADFEDITVYGSGKTGSRGFWIEGYDNTFSNIRIYDMETGIYSRSGTSLFKSIYVSADPAKFEDYSKTVGFYTGNWAWISNCVIENYAIAYDINDNRCILIDNTAKWTSELCKTQIALSYDSTVAPASGIRAEFLDVEDPVEISFVSINRRYVCMNERTHACGYVYTLSDNETEIPETIVCPTCKGGAANFEKTADDKYTCKAEITKTCNYTAHVKGLTEDTKCKYCAEDAPVNFVENSLPKMFEGCMFDESLVTDKTYLELLLTDVIPLTGSNENHD